MVSSVINLRFIFVSPPRESCFELNAPETVGMAAEAAVPFEHNGLVYAAPLPS
jgi:hypothetical protein